MVFLKILSIIGLAIVGVIGMFAIMILLMLLYDFIDSLLRKNMNAMVSIISILIAVALWWSGVFTVGCWINEIWWHM